MRFQDRYQELVNLLGGVRPAAQAMGCSRSTVSRLMRGQWCISVKTLRDHLRQAATMRKEPLDAEWLGELLFLYQVEQIPEALAHWRGFVRGLEGVGHQVRRRERGVPPAEQAEPLTAPTAHRDQLLARSVARHLRSMHAQKVLIAGHTRGLAEAIAVQQAIAHTEHLPPIDHLYLVMALLARAVPRDEHGLPTPYQLPDDLASLLPGAG